MTTIHRPQEPSTPGTVVAPAPDLLATCEISFDDLAEITGGADDRLLAHELAHVAQQRRGR